MTLSSLSLSLTLSLLSLSLSLSSSSSSSSSLSLSLSPSSSLSLPGRRPHLLYGSKEEKQNKSIKILEPLQNTYLEEFNPLEGAITQDTDKIKIGELMDELKPYLKQQEIGYSGERNDKGESHGQGTYKYKDGKQYSGGWKNGRQHGKGTVRFVNGTIYVGDFMHNKKHGKGEFIYSNGEHYEGDFYANLRHGRGKFTFEDGSWYEGQYHNSVPHGKGVICDANGDVIQDGYWYNDNYIDDEEITDWDAYVARKSIEMPLPEVTLPWWEKLAAQNSLHNVRDNSGRSSRSAGSDDHHQGRPIIPMCTFFLQNRCKYGDMCRFKHYPG